MARAEPAPAPAGPSFTDIAPPKPKNARDRVTFQLEDADLAELVKTIGELTGRRFAILSKKPIKATLYAPQKLSVEEAYRAFLAVLQSNGLTVVQDGPIGKIVESQDAVRQVPIVGDAPADERYVTRLHRMTNVSVDDIVPLLSKLQTRDGSVLAYAPGNLLILTDTGTNLRRMLELVQAIDVGESEERLWIEPLAHVASADLATKLDEVLDLKKKEAGGGELRISRVVAFDRPNAIAIVATERSYTRLREVLRQLDVPAVSEGQIRVVALQHADAKKIVGPLNELLGSATGAGAPAGAAGAPAAMAAGKTAVLEAAAKVTADETTNALLVSCSARDFAAIKDVIDRLDRPKRQVYIEAVVMDISAQHGTDRGVSWHGGKTLGDGPQDGFAFGGFNAAGSALPPDATSLQAFALGVRGPEVQLPFAIPIGTSSIRTIPSVGAFVTALAVSKGADILSSPTITASDNTPAELRVQLNTSMTPHAPQAPIIAGGTTLPVPTGAAQTVKVGPRIRITPHMNDSDEVRLDIEETISDVQSVPDKSDLYGSISFLERAANTTLTVKDGETMVIGGLVRNRLARTETKVPLLGDIPLLGALFRSSSETTEKSNLVLVLTPHIIRDEADKRRILENAMRARQEMIDRAWVFSGENWTPPVDWTRTRGLVRAIRRSQRQVERDRAEREKPPLASAAHDGVTPLDLPVPPHAPTTSSGAPPTTAGATKQPIRLEH